MQDGDVQLTSKAFQVVHRERMHLLLATGLTPGPPDLQGGEEIEPLLVTWPEALQMVQSGAIQDAKTLLGLLYYRAFEAT